MKLRGIPAEAKVLLRSSMTALALALWLVNPAQAQLLPQGFFDEPPLAGDGEAAVEADTLSFDSINNIVTAEGRVALRYNGYDATGQRLVYHPNEGKLFLSGDGVIIAPNGTKYEAEDLEITGGMKNAVLKSLTVTTAAGSTVTADDANFVRALETVLTEANYSPCGLCVDSKGRTIGWNIKSAKLVYDAQTKWVRMDQVNLEILGLPVAWLPFLSFPDPTDDRFKTYRLPSVDYDEQRGVGVYLPYQVTAGPDTDVLLSAKLMSRQGALLGVEGQQRFENGVINVSAAGIYQLDPDAYAGEVGDRDWRGMAQTTARFTPVKYWTTGWSYVTSTDAGFPSDYEIAVPGVSEVFVEHLSPDHFGEVRFQQFNRFSTYSTDDAALTDQELQARALPNARYENVTELGNGNGQVRVSSSLIVADRTRDHATTVNGAAYSLGHAGTKTHAMAQVAWQNQYVVGNQGVLVSPYLGLRLDASYYNNNSSLVGTPSEESLLAATPIAALDVRWPLIGAAGDVAHVVEPIAQLVYRGSDKSLVGITNDNAHSLVFEDSNLFSFNRFSGSDRQETGLRANIGARYQANISNGAYLEFLAGQSFHIAGSNGLGVVDGTQTGNEGGLGDDASYIVLGAKGGFGSNWQFGAKTQVDAGSGSIARAAASGQYTFEDGLTLGADYYFAEASPDRGVLQDQHEVTGRVSVPIMDYWTLTGSTSWDIGANQWLEASAGIGYDDGYLSYGWSGMQTGATHSTPNDTRWLWTLRLRGPEGIDVGVSQ